MELVKYDETEVKYVSYNRTVALNSSLTYMIKNAELTPYFKIYHENGTIGSGSNKYDKIYQGYFYTSVHTRLSKSTE